MRRTFAAVRRCLAGRLRTTSFAVLLGSCLLPLGADQGFGAGSSNGLIKPTPVDVWQHGPPMVLTINPARTLQPVSSGELMGGPQELAISMPQHGSRSAERLAPFISRRVPDLWQIRLAADALTSDLQISYELIAANGSSNSLSHAESPEQQLAARLRPLGPFSRPTPDNRIIVSGGVSIEIEAARVRLAGEYRGTIQITINQL